MYSEAKSESNDNNNNYLNNSFNVTGSYNKRKEEANLKELIDLLKKKENKIINLFAELEEINQNDPEIFKNLVGVRKDKNKETKLNIQKAKQNYCKYFFL